MGAQTKAFERDPGLETPATARGDPLQPAASHVYGIIPFGSEPLPISLRISVSEEQEEGPAPYITYEIQASASSMGALAAVHMALHWRLARLQEGGAIGAQHVQGGQNGGQIVAEVGAEPREGSLVIGQQILETALEDLRDLSRMAAALKVGLVLHCQASLCLQILETHAFGRSSLCSRRRRAGRNRRC